MAATGRMQIRFFNTYEPVTDIYRHIVPAIVQRGASVSVFVSSCDYRAGRRRLEDVVAGQDVAISRMLGPSGWAKSRMHKAVAALGYALHASVKSLFGKRSETNVFLTVGAMKALASWLYICADEDMFNHPDAFLITLKMKLVLPRASLRQIDVYANW